MKTSGMPRTRQIAILAIAFSTFFACETTKEMGNSRFPEAQRIIDTVSANHEHVVRLSVHAVPSGATNAMYIASTDPARIGRESDPEDIKAIDSGASTVLREGENFDVTVPIQDASGKTVAAGGITLSLPAGATEEQARMEAEEIGEELQKAFLVAATPIW